jgi:hypothetical protein
MAIVAWRARWIASVNQIGKERMGGNGSRLWTFVHVQIVGRLSGNLRKMP